MEWFINRGLDYEYYSNVQSEVDQWQTILGTCRCRIDCNFWPTISSMTLTHADDLHRSRVSDHQCLHMISSIAFVYDPLLISWHIETSWVYCVVSTILWRRGPLSFVGSRAVFQDVEIIAAGWVNRVLQYHCHLYVGWQRAQCVFVPCYDTSWVIVLYLVYIAVHSCT